jgi:hypothetical protein
MIKTGFKVYNLGADSITNISATVASNPIQSRIENNLINLYAF